MKCTRCKRRFRQVVGWGGIVVETLGHTYERIHELRNQIMLQAHRSNNISKPNWKKTIQNFHHVNCKSKNVI